MTNPCERRRPFLWLWFSHRPRIGALALDNLRREVVQDVMLDIDRDGRMDRAVLVRQADDSYVDLWVISELKTSLSTCLAVPIL